MNTPKDIVEEILPVTSGFIRRHMDEPENADSVIRKISEALHATEARVRAEKVDENTSDGYHTFKELYEFRKVYNAVLFNEWAEQGLYDVHKSTKHSDGEDCFGGGWFIVVAHLPTGYISNHYEMKDWDLFQCESRERGAEWDGHTAQDVLERLQALTQKKEALKALTSKDV